ncbi:MAG: cyanophycin synthetase [Egicoccus sp.]
MGFGGESWGRRLLEVAEVDTTTVGRGPEADIRIVDEHADVTGSRARLVGEGLDLPIGTGFPGRFNLSNAATAVVAAITAGIPAEVAATGVAACPGAPGRLERVDVGQPFTVLVDYAHTPDAIEQVVATMRDLLEPGRRIVLVLGAGGDRDRAKRGPMGAAAALADVAVFTSDNPRSEDPQAILDAVVAGAREAVDAGAPAEISAEPDRRDAIRRGLGAAGEGDVVVIAGKGHETGQEFADRTLPFDDRVVARELLQQGAA